MILCVGMALFASVMCFRFDFEQLWLFLRSGECLAYAVRREGKDEWKLEMKGDSQSKEKGKEKEREAGTEKEGRRRKEKRHKTGGDEEKKGDI